MEESIADKDRSRCSSERRVFLAQSQLSSSIRSEIIENEAHEKDDFYHSAFAESIEWITFMRANGTNVLHRTH